MSTNTPEAQAIQSKLAQARAVHAERAMHKLRYEVIPELERVIAATPTGPIRDSLTTANIILHGVVEGKLIPVDATEPAG